MQFLKFTLLAIALCLAPAKAQEAPKFAFLSFDYLIQETAQGRRIFAEAETLNRRLTEELRTKQEELQRMEQQLNSGSLSEEGRTRIAREFDDGRIAFQRMQEDSQAQYRRVLQTAMSQFETEITPIIQAVANEQNLQFVIQLQEGLLAWADEAWILVFTQEVGRRYDQAFASGSAPARSSAPDSAASGTPQR